MKFSETQNTRAVYIFLIVAASILLILFLLNIGTVFTYIGILMGILSPFLLGIAFAYILNFPMRFFEEKVFRFMEKRRPRRGLVRALSVALSAILFLACIAAFLAVILPNLANSISKLMLGLPVYLDSINKFISNLLSSFNMSEDMIARFSISQQDLSERLMEYVNTSLPNILNFSIGLTVSVSNAFIGLIVSIYFLMSKEKLIAQLKKVIYAVCSQKIAQNIITVARKSNAVFSGFLSAKLLDALIVGVLCFIGMSIMQMPYAMLISVVIGVTNIIPFFGPFIGAIPSALILLIVSPQQTLIFVIFIIIIQQIDGQIIGPRILGESIGISALWTIFAIILGVGLFGFWGLLLGVPVFAVIFSIVREIINLRLQKKGFPTQTKDYIFEPQKNSKNR